MLGSVRDDAGPVDSDGNLLELEAGFHRDLSTRLSDSSDHTAIDLQALQRVSHGALVQNNRD